MSQLWQLAFLYFTCLTLCTSAGAQTKASVEAPTRLSGTGKRPDSTRAAPAKSLTFTASTDRRFFFFKDTRNTNNRRTPVSVYGLRTGFLFPSRRSRVSEEGERTAAFKAGVGFYFANQDINRPGLLPNTSASVTRRLRYVMTFYEPYLFRRKAIEVSLPIELGYGHSRYERNDEQAMDYEVARGVFVPLGVGVTTAYHFPNIRWFRPFHWFGFNVLAGYRIILKKDVPESNINYNGFYLSIGPSFFLENLTSDISYWRQRRRKK